MMSRPVLLLGLCLASAITFSFQAQQPPTNAIPAGALAMVPKSVPHDTIHLDTNIGSFKFLSKGDQMPAGRLQFTFKGTVLITGVQPGTFVRTTGNVQKQYDSHGKQVYFGTGSFLIVGKFHNCQWFGQNLHMVFQGSAILRVTAEYDKNLETGTYWFEPTAKQELWNALKEIEIPEPQRMSGKAIKREDYEKQRRTGGGG